MKNRIIKFRVWDKVDYMSSPFTLEDLQLKKVQFTSDCHVMQFTGLCDKNGKEIYEGDILKGNHHDLFMIERINGGLQMLNVIYNGQNYNELIASPTCDAQTTSWLESAEVVGNIYQNPELLTNKH